jgi:hypothetical protein
VVPTLPLLRGAAVLVVGLASVAGATVPVGPELQVNTYTTNNQMRSVAAVEGDGDFVVAWESEGQDGNDKGIFAQRFSSYGDRIGIELQVNTHTPSFQQIPALAIDADGDFVVV